MEKTNENNSDKGLTENISERPINHKPVCMKIRCCTWLTSLHVQDQHNPKTTSRQTSEGQSNIKFSSMEICHSNVIRFAWKMCSFNMQKQQQPPMNKLMQKQD